MSKLVSAVIGDQLRRSWPTCRVGDFDIACASRSDLVDAAVADCTSDRDRPVLVFDANSHALSLARTNRDYRTLIMQGDIIHADGGFLVAISKWRYGPPIPERSATTDMIHDFAQRCQTAGLSFFLLGGEERINAACARILQRTYDGLKIVGRHHGFFPAHEEAAVVDQINRAAPDILWVGLGKPREQAFAVRWRETLTARWVITCGGCYNYVTGDYRRAPLWFQRNNLEWLHRLATNPRKLFWRYLVGNPHAVWIALTQPRPPR